MRNFDKELQIIEYLDSLDSAAITIGKDNEAISPAKITKKDAEIFIDVDNRLFHSKENYTILDNLHISLREKMFMIDVLDVKATYNKANSQEAHHSSCSSVRVLRTPLFLSTYRSSFCCFIRYDIQDKFKKLNDLIYQIETKNKIAAFNVGSVPFEITNKIIKDKAYLIIDSIEHIDFESFCNYCFSIKQMLGFITGYMPGGEEIFFSKEKEFYYSNHMRPAIDSLYYPVTTTQYPYDGIPNKHLITQRYENKINKIPTSVISNLVKLIHENQQFSSILILLLEGSVPRSLLAMPSIFSIVLEGLVKIIAGKQNKESLIQDKNLLSSIHKELQCVIHKYSDQLGENKKILTSRIGDLNRPKKLSNIEHLMSPFIKLDLKLSNVDIEIIKERNSLLHGHILLMEPSSSLEDTENYMRYTAAKLYTLISSLILKYAGYKGYIINHAKPYETFCGKTTSEDYYLEI